jgi:hypothetical protein
MVIVLVVAFFIPVAVSVLFGWRAWRSTPDRFPLPRWRSRFTFCGLIAATVGFLLETAYLIRDYAYSNLPSPLSQFWLVIAWTVVLAWTISILVALVGKGRVRLPLFFYVATSVVGIYLFLNLIMD